MIRTIFRLQPAAAAGVRADGDDLLEIAVGRRLPVTAQRDVVQPPQRFGHLAEPRPGEQFAGQNQLDRAIELGCQAVDFNELALAQFGTVALAVDAVEIADRVEVQVDADRHAAGPAADDQVT